MKLMPVFHCIVIKTDKLVDLEKKVRVPLMNKKRVLPLKILPLEKKKIRPNWALISIVL